MAGELVKPLLSLPPSLTPSTAAILIVQTLECKRLACKCKLSKEILQHALKILLCDDDSSLFPNHKNQSINSFFQTQLYANVAIQTDSNNQNDMSVQTEKCRIKLQNSGYKYTFNDNDENSNVSTQVTFNDFSDPINAEDSDEMELCIESPTEIMKNKQAVTGSGNQINLHIAKGQKKFKLKKPVLSLLDFHGKRLIDETKSRPPFTIPLVCNSDAEVYDPRTFVSNISNKSEGSSHLPWRAEAICNCTAFKQNKSYDQKESFGIVESERLNLLDTNTDIKNNSCINSINENKLNDVNYYQDINNSFSQNKVSNVTKTRATVTEEMSTTNYLCHNNVKNKETHLMDCFCNLAPREACASDPRIKLICADVSSNAKPRMKRNSRFSNNKPLPFKKTKFEQCTEHILVTSNTTEKFGCLTPNESPVGSPETPVNLTPESFVDEEHQNNSNQKSLHRISFNKSYLNKNPNNIELEILLPSYKKVSFKQVSSVNGKPDLFKDVNKNKSIATQHHLSNSIECNKVENDQEISHLLKGNDILKQSSISANNSLLLSSKDEKNKDTRGVNAENIPKLPITNVNTAKEASIINKQNSNFYEEFSDAKKSAEEYKSKLSGFHQSDTNCLSNILDIPSSHTTDVENKQHFDDNQLSKVKLSQHSRNDMNSTSNLLDIPSYCTTDSFNKQHFGNNQHNEEKLPMHSTSNQNTMLNLLDIPSYETSDNKNEKGDDSQTNLETTVPQVYSPTDDLSMDSDCDYTLPTGCIASSPPDKSPILELDKNENLIKTKEEKTSANPYQKVIAAVPSYIPTRHLSVLSTEKPLTGNSDKCDKMSKQLQPPILNSDKCDKILMTSQDTSVSKTDDKIDDIPSYSKRVSNLTASMPLSTVRKSMENEMTQTEPEVKEWNSCSPWLQPNSFQNYYKWCGQGNEFTQSHYQTYYPPYTNNYPPIAPNWMWYQWWNAKGSRWNQSW